MIATVLSDIKMNKDKNNRDFKTRMLRVGGERCPVAPFKFFTSKRAMIWSFLL